MRERKYKIGDVLKITNTVLLNDGYDYPCLKDCHGKVYDFGNGELTYLLHNVIDSDGDVMDWVVHENNLEPLEPSSHPNIYFEPVIDSMRKHPNVDLIYPKMGSKTAIACDFYSPVDAIIKPKTYLKIYLDFKAIFPSDLGLFINVRSNMGDDCIMLVNTQGWIESDYANNKKNDGNLIIGLYNFGEEDYIIKQGDRIAQGTFLKVYRAEGTETDIERVGGHGSTGK